MKTKVLLICLFALAATLVPAQAHYGNGMDDVPLLHSHADPVHLPDSSMGLLGTAAVFALLLGIHYYGTRKGLIETLH
ncbi:MAG: hypothetical protein V4526_00330 [Patescibacteria group bacterium]